MKTLYCQFYASNKSIMLVAAAAFCAVVVVNGAFAEDIRVPFTRVVIDASPPDRPWYKMVGDIDGDGDLDIVVGGAKGPLVWYAYPTWQKSQIAGAGWDGVKGEVADIDGDGDADIINGGVKVYHLAAQKYTTWSLYSRDRPGCQSSVLPALFFRLARRFWLCSRR